MSDFLSDAPKATNNDFSDLGDSSIDLGGGEANLFSFSEEERREEEVIRQLEKNMENDFEVSNEITMDDLGGDASELGFTTYEEEIDKVNSQTKDPVKNLWKQKAAKQIADYAGLNPEHILENFESYSKGIAGTDDPKGTWDYVKKQYEAGQIFKEANKEFYAYLYGGRDEERLEKYLDLMQKAPDLPAPPHKLASAMGLVAQNAPQMGESAAEGLLTGGLSALGVGLMATGAGFPAGAGLTGTSVLGSAVGAFGVGQLARSGAYNFKQMSGAFGSEMYMELKENGIEPDMDMIAGLAAPVGAVSTVLETAQWGSAMSNIPGMDKVMKSVLQDKIVGIMKSGKNTFVKNAVRNGISTASKTAGGRAAGVAIENAAQEATQAMIFETGRELYRTLQLANEKSAEVARRELIESGMVSVYPADIREYKGKNKKDVLPKKTIDELVNRYYTEALAGAIVGGTMSLPGTTVRGIKSGTEEYRMAKSTAESVVKDIVDNTNDPDMIMQRIRENETLRTVLGNKKTEKWAQSMEDVRAYQKVLDLRRKEMQSDDMHVWKTPEGEIYDTEGYRLPDAPSEAVIHETEYNDDGKIVDDLGNTYDIAPWDPKLHLKNVYSGESEPLQVHKNPETGKYVDEFGNEYDDPPEEAQVWEWKDYEGGFAYIDETDEAGNVREKKYLTFGNKPWEQSHQVVEYTDPVTGKTVERVSGKVSGNTLIDPEAKMKRIQNMNMTVREEQARALWHMDVEKAKSKGEDFPTFENWIKDNEIKINNDIGRRFQADVTADLRNFRHVRDYAKSFLDQLKGDERAFFEPAVKKLDNVINDLEAGSSNLKSFEDVMNQYASEMDQLYNDLAKMRTQAKNAKDKRTKNKIYREIEKTNKQIMNKARDSKMFEDLLTKTHTHLANAYFAAQQQKDRLEAMAEKSENLYEESENVIEETKETLGEAVDREEFKGKDAEGGWWKYTEENKQENITTQRKNIDWAMGKSKLAGRLEVYAEMGLNRMQSSNKQKVRRRMIDLASRIMKEAPGTVHVEERSRIEALQKLIDPAFRTEEKAIEMTKEWQDKYDQLVNTIREGTTEEKYAAIDEALDAAKKPLNKMTMDDLTDLYYSVEMLKAIGKAKYDAEKMNERIQEQVLVDYAVDSAKNLDLDMVHRNVDSKEYQDYFKSKGIKKKSRDALSLILNPANMIDYLEGGGATYSGPLSDVFIKGRNKAYGEMKTKINERRQGFEDFLDSIDYDRGRLYEQINVMGDTLDIQTIMSYYIARGEEGRLEGSEHMYKYLISKNGNNVNPAQMDAAVESLTEQDKQVVDYILSDYKEVFPRLNKTFRDLNNENLEEVNTYVPILFNKSKEEVDKEAAGERSDEATGTMWDTILKGDGNSDVGVFDSMTYRRVDVPEHKMRPIQTKVIDNWNKMLDREERYINMAPIIKKMKRVINDDNFKNAVRGTAGEGWLKSLDQFVKSQAKPYWWRDYENGMGFFSKVRRNTAIAYLGFSAQTMLKQAPSMAYFMKEAGLANMLKAVGEYASGGEFFRDGKIRKYLKENDPNFKYRQSEVETVMMKQDFNNASKIKAGAHKMGEMSMSWIQWMDSQVVAIGEYATIQAMKDKGHSEADAILTAQDITQRTQPNADPGMLPRIYKTNEAFRMALLFAQQRMKIVDMMAYDLPQKVKTKQYKAALGEAIALNLGALGIMLASEKRLPESEEEFAKWYSKYWASTLPLVGDRIVSFASGYGVQNPVDQATKGLFQGAKQAWKSHTSPSSFPNKNLFATKNKGLETFNKVLESSSVFMGLPTKPIRNIIEAYNENSPWELVGGQEEREGGFGEDVF